MARDSMSLYEVISEIENSVRLGAPTWTSPEAITNALSMLKDYKQLKAENTRASGWISCSERMPEEDGEYLCVSNGEFKILPYKNGEFYCTCFDAVLRCCNSSVTHWMPLPELPETEDKA